MKKFPPLIILSVYAVALTLSLFFGDNGKMIISQLTGVITAICCGLATIFFCFIPKKISPLVSLTGASSFLCLFIGYILYLFFHISPSNYTFPAHSYISMLFDIGTSGVALFSFLMYKSKVENNGKS